MQYELSEQEVQHIEKYRDLLPEFQNALDEHIKTLFDLQTRFMKDIFESIE